MTGPSPFGLLGPAEEEENDEGRAVMIGRSRL